jgi:hypothetical protein
MGFFRDLVGLSPKTDIKAQLAPSVMGDPFNYYSPLSAFKLIELKQSPFLQFNKHATLFAELLAVWNFPLIQKQLARKFLIYLG